MLGNFVYSNPTKLYFGEDSLQYLNEELPKYGKTVRLIYGSEMRQKFFGNMLTQCQNSI